jgi:hypothetical protein
VEKCAQEAGERRVRAIPAIADRSSQTPNRVSAGRFPAGA